MEVSENEHLFRIWDEDEKCYGAPPAIGLVDYPLEKVPAYWKVATNALPEYADRFKIEAFSGILSALNTPVFSGDVIECVIGSLSDQTFRGHVFFTKGHWYVGDAHGRFYLSDAHDIMIVGNIHEDWV